MSFAKESMIKMGAMLLGVICLGATGWWGYKVYVHGSDEKAQLVFSACMKVYDGMMQNKESDWAFVAKEFNNGYVQYKHSSYGPYFLAMEASALLHNGQKEEALVALEKALDGLSKNVALYPIYAAKRAILLLDMPDEAHQQQGITLLTQLAEDKRNMSRDLAQFYLGQYYATHGNYDKARLVWHELVMEQMHAQPPHSPWALRAEKELTSIA